MANQFKQVIDRQMWVQVTPSRTAPVAGSSVASDLRSTALRNPFVYFLSATTALDRFNIVHKSWQRISTAPFTGTLAAGATSYFVPSFGAVGTIAAGATTTSFTVSTALPAAVGPNQLANRGGGGQLGYKVRLIDTTAGKTEERWIVANTSGTTPTITVDAAFTFTPASGARYELLAGRLFMLSSGTLAAGGHRSFEVSTNAFVNRAITNLPVISTDSQALVLDEQYTPYNHKPGEGMVKGSYTYDTSPGLLSLTATGSASTTLTGQSSGGDAVVAANEYRNFQIRIVEDTGAPTAVGQRRMIASHTAGSAPVYTLGTSWTVTPSTTAKYVIELPNLVVLRTSAVATVYTYNYSDATVNNGTASLAADTWSSTFFTSTGASAQGAGGVWAPSFGIQPDAARIARHSYCYFFRGAGTTTLERFDLAGGTAGAWAAVTYDSGTDTFTTGACGVYAPFGNEGRFTYINVYVASQVAQMHRFDARNLVLSPIVATDLIFGGTAVVGQRMAAYVAIDGTDLYDVILAQSHASSTCQELIPLV